MSLRVVNDHWLAALLLSEVCLLGGCDADSTRSLQQETAVPIAVADPLPRQRSDFVGSQVCAECHQEIAEQYRGHSMSRSAASLGGQSVFPRSDLSTFEADGFRYSVRQQGQDWLHHQGRLGKSGTEMSSIDLVVKHVIGSGHHGQSYLVERDDYLFLSPITWYPDKEIWDLSPGYETINSQFNRPVVEACLYCHTDFAAAIDNTVNRYASPPILSHAIGCERCHGAGSRHVAIAGQENAASDGWDTEIVNPGQLTLSLREAVCQQCHLSGAARITKPGKSLFDYRPGQPLESAFTVFLLQSDSQQDRQFVGQVEQMYASQCFQQSEDFGCISCHDPHGLPSSEEKLKYYRDRCVQCHTEDACGESKSNRIAVTAEDSCVVCHMPSQPTEIRHAAITDHSIPRWRDPKRATSGPSTPAPSTAAPSTPAPSTPAPSTSKRKTKLFAFPSDDFAKPTPRDASIALALVGGREPELLGTVQRKGAQRALEKAIKSDADDFEAMDALAKLYLKGDEIENAMRVCKKTLVSAPRREQTLIIVAETLSGLQRFEQAIPIWERTIEVNPWISMYWYRLAQAYATTGQWSDCRRVASAAKERFPTSIGVRQLLVQSHLKLGDSTAAETEFRELEEFRPPRFELLHEWYRKARQAGKQAQR